MTEDILKYTELFVSGMRVEVELPWSEEKQFRDEAIIIFAHQDLLVLQLTREMFPEEISLESGTGIHLRTGKQGKGYRYRAILLSRDRHARFKIRLTGEMLPFNDREFFRVDVFIPLSYRPKSDQGRWTMKEAEPAGSARNHHPKAGRSGLDAIQNQPLPVAANLSGAGVKINIPERFEIGVLLDLMLYLPLGGTRSMALVGQVVHVVELSGAGDPHPLFSTALHFVSLDDTQREALIGFIQRAQLQQLRMPREESPPQSGPALDEPAEPRLSMRVRRILWAILLTLLAVTMVLSLDHYRRNKSKGEIEITFEEQIRKIIERR